MNFKSFINIQLLGIHLLSILAFILIDLAYFSPLFEGKRMLPVDNQQNIGSGREARFFMEKTGEQTLWTNSIFSGMPTYHVSITYPNNICTYFIDFFKQFPLPLGYVLLYMIGFYIMFLCMRAGPLLSFLGAVAVAFTSYNFIILEAGHNTKAMAIAFAGPIMGGLFMVLRGNYLWGGFIAAFALALDLRAKHIQITYYLFILIGILFIVELIYALREKALQNWIKSVTTMAVAVLVGVGTNASVLWTTYEYSEYSKRGQSELTNAKGKQIEGLSRKQAFAWSYGWAENLTFLIPDAFGGSSHTKFGKESQVYKTLKKVGAPPDKAQKICEVVPSYWGDQPFVAGPVYMGSVLCFLFLMGLVMIKGKARWWVLAGLLLSIGLAMGKNFIFLSNIFFRYVPLYNKFRAVTMFHAITAIVIGYMAILFLQHLKENKFDQKKITSSLLLTAGILTSIFLVFALFPQAVFDFNSSDDKKFSAYFPEDFGEIMVQALKQDRISMMKIDSFRSITFLVLTSILIYLFVKNVIKYKLLLISLIILVINDLWPINKRYLNIDDFEPKRIVDEPFVLTNVDQQIMNDKDLHFRVLDRGSKRSPYSNSRTSYFHKSVGGYNSAYIKRYEDIIENHLEPGNQKVFNMLNTKYLILPNPNTGKVEAKVDTNALGNAWFVDSLFYVESADEEITALDSFNPQKTAVIDIRFEKYFEDFEFHKDDSAKISLIHYRPNHMTYASKCSNEQFAVFSEIYYNKGWQAYINGKPTDHIRVNYILRAMKIPPGNNTIEFAFYPASFYVGEKISLAFSSVLVLGFLFISFLSFKKNKIIHVKKFK